MMHVNQLRARLADAAGELLAFLEDRCDADGDAVDGSALIAYCVANGTDIRSFSDDIFFDHEKEAHRAVWRFEMALAELRDAEFGELKRLHGQTA